MDVRIQSPRAIGHTDSKLNRDRKDLNVSGHGSFRQSHRAWLPAKGVKVEEKPAVTSSLNPCAQGLLLLASTPPRARALVRAAQVLARRSDVPAPSLP